MAGDINQIKTLRKSLNITQKDLAKHSGVSQSLIAKIESGRIDPAYSKVQMINEALNSFSKKKSKKAEDIMIKQIIKLSKADTIKKAITKMRKYNISQMPVFEEKQVVGFVSDSIILNSITEGMNSESIIETIMDDAPPTISRNTEITVVTELLKQFPLVIISEKGTTKGIITKADLFNSLY